MRPACVPQRRPAVGGHAYGWVYPGPMGSLLTPLFGGIDKALDLPPASTLCPPRRHGEQRSDAAVQRQRPLSSISSIHESLARLLH
ncbi:MAG: hypothetical protein DVS81_13205 [Candidatus Accumulibacter meliphilus]|uniref:Uncharacterized protein n=1 Tax=Candidatus Accumulibacter meliphilus TaxID=2211374 RepID=A0A369XMU9_9PROT|nr:MAG: hypothetical protein DVS81_13205 [Candidatus Accumulibacter meliphilus]